jgi:Kef-type K+ transport system membrane component KefB
MVYGSNDYTARTITVITVLVIMAAMVLVPWILWRTLQLESWMPLPMFQIFCGILIGPSAFGAYYPELFSSVFTQPVRSSLDTIQTLAIIVFAFMAGLELKPREVLRTEGHGIWLKAVQVIVVPILLAALCFYLFFDSGLWHDARSSVMQFAWAMGVATCITALPMLVIAAKSVGIHGTDLYHRLLALVTFDDLILWITVSLIVAFGKTMFAATVFFAATALMYWLWPKLMDYLGESAWPTLTVTLVFAWSAFSYWAGLHWLLGAFLAGMIIPRHTTAWLGGMDQHQMYWLMPVFFIWTGLKVQWTSDFAVIIGAALAMYVIAVATKFAGVWLAYRDQGLHMVMFKTALLQNKGLMEIFLATVLLKAQIITGDMFAAVVIMSLISTGSAVPLARMFKNKTTTVT